AVAEPRAAERRVRKRPRWKDTWWRHLVAILAVVVSLFPIAYIVSAAFSANASLTGSTLIPSHVTLVNFTHLIHGSKAVSEQIFSSVHYGRWYLNTVIVATFTALFTVMLGALAAYAFSRFRFKGRRMGMLFLLLVQMFPQPLAVTAIYLIVLRIGDVFSGIGLNTL